jgi:hypothetical protein
MEHTDGLLKDVEDPTLEASPRQLMQFIGTELLQLGLQERFPKIGRTIFCGPLIHKLETIDYSIVTDLRFVHEYQALSTAAIKHDAQLYIIRVERSKGVDDSDAHPSETEYESIPTDYIVLNDSTRSELDDRADLIRREILSKYDNMLRERE